MPRKNLLWAPRSLSSRREKSRERLGGRPPIMKRYGAVVKSDGSSLQPLGMKYEAPVTRSDDCPVCKLPRPMDLQAHLAKYHSHQDMSRAFVELMRPRRLPGNLSYFIAHSKAEAVSRVLAVFSRTGYLQVPAVSPPRTVTRVLWRALPVSAGRVSSRTVGRLAERPA